MKTKYKSKWTEGKLNKKFWTEVMVGRKIISLKWNKNGVAALILDSGEEVMVVKNEHNDAVFAIYE